MGGVSSGCGGTPWTFKEVVVKVLLNEVEIEMGGGKAQPHKKIHANGGAGVPTRTTMATLEQETVEAMRV